MGIKTVAIHSDVDSTAVSKFYLFLFFNIVSKVFLFFNIVSKVHSQRMGREPRWTVPDLKNLLPVVALI